MKKFPITHFTRYFPSSGVFEWLSIYNREIFSWTLIGRCLRLSEGLQFMRSSNSTFIPFVYSSMLALASVSWNMSGLLGGREIRQIRSARFVTAPNRIVLWNNLPRDLPWSRLCCCKNHVHHWIQTGLPQIRGNWAPLDHLPIYVAQLLNPQRHRSKLPLAELRHQIQMPTRIPGVLGGSIEKPNLEKMTLWK